MKAVERTVWEAEDGSIHETEAACQQHEAAIAERAKRTTYWSVHHSPDLTEGRGHYGHDYLQVYGPPDYIAEEWVHDYCFRIHGRRLQFVQGNSPITGWSARKIDRATFYDCAPEAVVGSTKKAGRRLQLEIGAAAIGLVEAVR